MQTGSASVITTSPKKSGRAGENRTHDIRVATGGLATWLPRDGGPTGIRTQTELLKGEGCYPLHHETVVHRAGIEPAYLTWQAIIFPLNYRCVAPPLYAGGAKERRSLIPLACADWTALTRVVGGSTGTS